MKSCPECHVTIKGNWTHCPLCGSSLNEIKESKKILDPYPRVPLQFNRRRAFQFLRLLTILSILFIFIAELVFSSDRSRIEYVILAMISTWAAVAIFIRKKRNIAKGIVYLILFLSLFSLYFDRLNGWTGWSLSYAVPIVCSACLVAMLISIKVIRLDVHDYILYLQLAAILGTIPFLFLVFNWTTVLWPSVLSISLSVLMFFSFLFAHWQTIFNELKKRMDV